jgi:hypothetical protein
MTFHLTRSDGGEGSRKEGDDQIMLSIIFVCIVDGPILCGRKSEIQSLPADQFHSLFCFGIEKRKKEQ